MRNTKIALAVLALVASTAAMADGATLYGVVDAGVSQVDGGKTTFGGTGNWAGNILGISASEDLDGGMKASVNYELGYDIGTGNNGVNGGITQAATPLSINPNGNPFFNRKANVSLAGEFGTVTAGLQVSPFIGAATGGSSLTGNQSFYVNSLVLAGSGVAASSGLGASPAASGFFIPNAVSYSSPSIGGFSAKALAQVTGSASVDTGTSVGKNDNKYNAYAASYAAGDVTVNAGWQKRDGQFTAGSATAPGANYNSYAITGSYTMGATTLGAGYISHQLNTAPGTSTTVNVTYGLVAHKVSDAVVASLGYAQNNASTKASLLNVGLQYNLNSKGTTYLYATGGQSSKTAVSPIYGGTAGDTAGNTKGYAVGIVKGF